MEGDGRQDLLFVNSIHWPERNEPGTHAALYHNQGNGTFADITSGSDLDLPYTVSEAPQPTSTMTVRSMSISPHSVKTSCLKRSRRWPMLVIQSFPQMRFGSITTETDNWIYSWPTTSNGLQTPTSSAP